MFSCLNPILSGETKLRMYDTHFGVFCTEVVTSCNTSIDSKCLMFNRLVVLLNAVDDLA